MCIRMSPKRTVSLLDAPIDEDVPGLPEDDTLREMSCCGCWIRPNIRQRPHYAGEIWKRNLFLRLDLPSTLIRHENRAFRKRSLNRRNLKTPALRFRVEGKHFENEDFSKTRPHDNHVISFPEFSLNTNPNDRWLLRFQIFPAWCGRKHAFYAFFRTFALIVSAQPYCARKFTCHVMHERAR